MNIREIRINQDIPTGDLESVMPERESDDWHTWRNGLTPELQALADQGVLLPGDQTHRKTVEIYNSDGTSEEIPSEGILIDNKLTVMIPEGQQARQSHGSIQNNPKHI